MKRYTIAAATLVFIALASCQSKAKVQSPDQPKGASAETAPIDPAAPRSIRDSIVTVTIRGGKIPSNPMLGDTEGVRTRSGIVIADGRVMLTLRSLDGAEWAEIVDSNGVKSTANGVAYYLHAGHIALLDVAWTRTPPPSATIVPVTPAGEATFEFMSTRNSETRAATLIECRTPTEMYAAWSPCPDPTAPHWIAVQGNHFLGLITGQRLSIEEKEAGCNATCGVYMPRPEILRAIQPGSTIPWPDWTSRFAAIQRSNDLTKHLLEQWQGEPPSDPAPLLEAIRNAIELDPQNTTAWTTLASVSLFLRDFDTAESSARRTLELIPTDRAAGYVKAQLLLQRDDYQAALETIQVLNAENTNPKGYYIESVALTNLGRYEDAIRAIKFAMLLDPRNKDYPELLSELERRVPPPPKHGGAVKRGAPKPPF